jgi:hypothetical protein
MKIKQKMNLAIEPFSAHRPATSGPRGRLGPSAQAKFTSSGAALCEARLAMAAAQPRRFC